MIPVIARCLLVIGLLAGSPALPAAAPDITPEQIKVVAADLVCLCGTCNRESLATCVCTAFAIPEREAIGRSLIEGQSREQIIAQYVDRFGTMVLASPPGGYSVVGFLTPVAILLVGVLVVGTVLVSWRRSPKPAAPETGPRAEGNQRYADQLKRDLDTFDGG